VKTEAAQAERGAALERLQAIVDCMADGVIYIDADERIALVNHAGRVLRSLNDGPGRPVRDCHPASVHATLDRVLAYFRHGDETGPAHSIIKEREGRFETTYAPVRSAKGEYLGIVMVIRDIAERRSLERRLLDAERLATLGQMSAQVAHQLRNPLNAIGGAVQYLRRVLRNAGEVQEYGELIEQEVRRVNRFIDDLLRVARPAEPVFARANVNDVAREAARRVCLARGLDTHDVELELAAALPDLELDARLMMEAIVNLLDNAFEAEGTEPPELATYVEASDATSAVIVQVRDRGRGIPPEQLEEVGRPFVTTKTSGTGLGLVIVNRVAEQHRGGFSLAAREGGGMVATLRLPVRTLRVDARGAA